MLKICLLLLMICLYKPGNAQEITVGTRVEVTATDGKVYKGTIMEIIHTAHKIHYDGYDKQYDAWMTRDQFKLIGAVPVAPVNTKPPPVINNAFSLVAGSNVEVYSNKRWKQGTIVEVKNGKYKIRYDGYSENWDTWETSNELRAPGTNGDVKISNDKAAKGKLYLRHIRWLTGGSSLNWYFLADNGTIVLDPKHGANPVNLAEERVDNMSNMGAYVLSNNLLKVKWLNGTTNEVLVEYKNGEIISIDAFSIVVRQTGFPANYKLNGTYSGVLGVGNVAQARTFTFSTNGTFTNKNTGFVTTGDGNAMAEKNNSGNYSIIGNTLVLNYADGKIEKAPIAIWSDRLVINNTSLPLVGK
jgi:hypothetical protein